MKGFIHSWLSIWLYVATAIAIVFAIYSYRKWKNWDWGTRLLAIFAIWIVPHVWEEWIIPGGFHYIYNWGSTEPERYPMSELTDMITNFGLLIVNILVFLKWKNRPAVIIGALLFCCLEVFAHTTLVSRSLNDFGSKGQTVWYAPGLVTAMIGYFPLLIGFIVYLVRNKIRPSLGQWFAGVVLMVFFVAIIFGPESVLKDHNSPYPFPNAGYYDQFISKP